MQAVRDNARASRVFSFGIGNSVNRFLLEEMARAGRGVCEIVTLSDDADPVIDRLVRRIDAPVLTDIELAIDPALGIHDVLPGGDHLPDLFDAEPIVLMGRFDRAASGEIVVRGRTAAGAWERRVRVELPAEETKHDVVKSLWARAKVDDLLLPRLGDVEQGTLDPRTKAAVIRLGEAFSIATPYTSFVAVEKSRVTVGGKPMLVSVPVELPDGTNWAGFFGEGGLEALPMQVRDGGVGGRATGESAGVNSSAVTSFLRSFPAKAVDRGLIEVLAGEELSDSLSLAFALEASDGSGGAVDSLSAARREPTGGLVGKRAAGAIAPNAAPTAAAPPGMPAPSPQIGSASTASAAAPSPAKPAAPPPPSTASNGPTSPGGNAGEGEKSNSARPGSTTERFRRDARVGDASREQQQGQDFFGTPAAGSSGKLAEAAEGGAKGATRGLGGGLGGGSSGGLSGGSGGGSSGGFGGGGGAGGRLGAKQQKELGEAVKGKRDAATDSKNERAGELLSRGDPASTGIAPKGAPAGDEQVDDAQSGEGSSRAVADSGSGMPLLTEAERDSLVRVLDRRLLVIALAVLVGDDGQIPALAKELGCGDGSVFEVAMKVALDAKGGVDARVLESLRALGVTVEDEVAARGLVMARVPPQALVKAALIAGVKRMEPVVQAD